MVKADSPPVGFISLYMTFYLGRFEAAGEWGRGRGEPDLYRSEMSLTSQDDMKSAM